MEAYRRVREVRPEAGLDLLYTLEGALLDERWDRLPRELRAELGRQAGR